MKLTTKIVATVGAAAALGLAAGPVAGADAGCVSKREFRHVKRGMTQSKVASIFDTNGTQSVRVGSFSARDYKTCTGSGLVTVNYRHRRVTTKVAIW